MIIHHCSYSSHKNGYHDKRINGFDQFLIRLQIEGKAQARIGKHTYSLEQGDLIFVPPNTHYQLTIHPNQLSGDYHLFVKGDWLRSWWKELGQPNFASLSTTDPIVTLWRLLSTENLRPTHEQTQALNTHLLKSILLMIKEEINARHSIQRPFIVTRMMRYIEEHALESITLEDVANEVELSVSRASHLFKDHTDKTMIQYAQHIKLEAAINQMKYTNMTLEQIALMCGFGNYPYFHRLFTRKYELSPSQYRKVY
ncbi:transcriptional regulator, AraC family [Pelagirhabdus alkalitolerans]|uniref:Transcriptional regulator, AraC family n=1 Tax=Pelagirhabdus alkalitolerans TaxID=1612202 RepID=A0A1G6GLH5_9BACI|nr:AraC family transcriptional regulator [Pelagirhabdus alkalitolerans]SDB82784.1 transcriptional regulator, AraC family [Pelagirhabdus alkalitolerans]